MIRITKKKRDMATAIYSSTSISGYWCFSRNELVQLFIQLNKYFFIVQNNEIIAMTHFFLRILLRTNIYVLYVNTWFLLIRVLLRSLYRGNMTDWLNILSCLQYFIKQSWHTTLCNLHTNIVRKINICKRTKY